MPTGASTWHAQAAGVPWFLQHGAEQGRTTPVPRGSGPVRPLPRRPQIGANLLDTNVRCLDGRTRPAHDVLVATASDAVLILHEGAIALEWYAPPMTATTRHLLLSVTKSFVGAVAGILMAQGRLDASAPVRTYVPELADGAYAGAKVRDLLDMRSGVRWVEDHDDPGSHVEAMSEILHWQPAVHGLPDSLYTFLTTLTSDEEPGGGFRYRSGDTVALGWVLERASGTPMPELLGSLLLAPIGAEADAMMAVDGHGVAAHDGGLSLVPRDLARFGQMLLDSGAVRDEQVVPVRFLQDTRDGDTDSVAAFRTRVTALAIDAPAATRTIYRNQFWVPEAGVPRFLCLGVHGQVLVVDVPRRCVAVKLSSWPTPRDPVRFTDGLACLDALMTSVADAPRPGHAILSGSPPLDPRRREPP